MSDSQRIIHYIGVLLILTVAGCIGLAAMGKTGPDWAGDVLKVGVGALGGAVVGGGATAYALKPREKDEEAS